MAVNPDKLNEFMGKAVGDIGAAMSAALVYLGDRFGLYKSLAKGPMTSTELAKATGTHERYIREWLLNQAAGGYIQYDSKAAKYYMTEEQAFALADDTSPAYLAGAFDIIGAVHRDVNKVADVFKSGKGIPWGEHDQCLFCGTEKFFAAGYRGNLLSSWIPALDGVQSRLADGVHVADVGCGHGASTILMAKAFPRSTFIGFDAHAPSIACARKQAAGLENLSFEVADATSFPAPKGAKNGGWDLVACFDCLHDMGDPVGCAAHVHKSLAKGGSWMIVEPAAADTVEGNLNPVARVFSAASTMICVPASIAFNGPALGACAGFAKLSDTIKQGGFKTVRKATETPFNIILEARG